MNKRVTCSYKDNIIVVCVCVCDVCSITKITEFSAMIHPISKAALTAIPSARTVELAKPMRRGGVHQWIWLHPVYTVTFCIDSCQTAQQEVEAEFQVGDGVAAIASTSVT